MLIIGRPEAVGWNVASAAGTSVCQASQFDERSNNSVWQRLQENDFKARGSFISEKPAKKNSILKFPTSEVKLSDTS